MILASLALALAISGAGAPPLAARASDPAAPIAVIGAEQLFAWGEGQVYRIACAPGRVTDIALQPGETVLSIASGDTARWAIGDATSGEGDAQRTHILAKPFAAGLATNLVVLTSKRSYHLELRARETGAAVAVRWTYPADALLAVKRAREAQEATKAVESGLAVGRLNFAYRISGDKPAWRPVQVFDDGAKSYIALPATIAQGEAPPLFLLDEADKAALVNYRIDGRFYVVDRLFARAELRLGSRRQQIVRITRMGAR